MLPTGLLTLTIMIGLFQQELKRFQEVWKCFCLKIVLFGNVCLEMFMFGNVCLEIVCLEMFLLGNTFVWKLFYLEMFCLEIIVWNHCMGS